LVDVSGSMNNPNKLGLLKEGLKLLVEELRPEDRVAIVTYASSPGVALASTSCEDKATIIAAIDALAAGGSTNGEGGINAAYEIAQQNYVDRGNNRIILASDGDFNVGISNLDDLKDLIAEKRETGIFLTTLGFGSGNYSDAIMEQLANKGNGTYEYIDNLEQAKKVFIYDFGKFFTVAKDVKIQIEFDPAVVDQYRLIGYANRLLETEDFEDDEEDAGELGSNQTITAIYEIVPQSGATLNSSPLSIDFRYKHPDYDTSIPFTVAASDQDLSWNETSDNFRFAASVAAYGMLLRDSNYKGSATFESVKNWANASRNYDPNGFKAEFVQLVDKAESLQ